MYPNMIATPPDGEQPEPKRRSWPRRHKVATGFIAGGVVLAGIIAASVASVPSGQTATPGSSSPPAATAPAAPIPAAPAPAPADSGPVKLALGEPAEITDDTGDLGSVTVESATATSVPADQYGEAPQNGEFLIAKIRADATGAFSVGTPDFYAVVGGEHYDEGDGNALYALSGDDFGYPDLNAGEHKTGKLVFDVPAGKHGWIVYAPNFDGPAVAKWRF